MGFKQERGASDHTKQEGCASGVRESIRKATVSFFANLLTRPRHIGTPKEVHHERHIRSIDQLRGVAILAVIVFHLSHYFVYPAWFTPHMFVYLPWLRNGWMGVNLFFILSGFVLYWPYAREHRSMHGMASASEFLRHRAKRLLPLYYLSTAILFAIQVRDLDAAATQMQAVTLLTATFNFFPTTFFPRPNWVLWSLGVEIWFSILFPLLVVGVASFGFPRVAIFVFTIALLVRIAGTYVTAVQIPGQLLNPLRDSVLGRLDDFFVGMLIAAWYTKARVGWQPRRATCFLLLLLGVTISTCAPVLWELSASGRLVPKGLIAIANNVFQAGIALVLVALLGTQRGRRSIISYPLELMGMMCFSLYIWHGVVMQSMVKELSFAGVAAYAIALSIVAGLSYRYVEFGRTKTWQQLLPN